MNLFDVLVNVFKSRIVPLVTRVKLLLNPRFMVARFTEIIRNLVQNVLNVRPRNKDDYYPIGGWLVAKKLAYAVVIVTGILCIIYIVSQKDALFPGNSESYIKTYNYNSILLKFAKGKVRIKGKSGWIAYEGNVEDAACNGSGTLMTPEGIVIYEGNFKSSMYEDKGTQYYENGILRYVGDFHENQYNGEGKLYRETGSIEYNGEILRGLKDGEGRLFNTGGEEIYNGQFSQDKILYSSLLGKSSTEMAMIYNGTRKLYEAGNERVRVMDDIGAMTEEITNSESIESTAMVSAVYVMDNSIRIGSHDYTTFDGIQQALGEPTYVGDSYATLPELMIINRLNEGSDIQVINGTAEITLTDMFDEYSEVEYYDPDYIVYLHSYEKDGLVYNFVSSQDDSTFAFYYILQSTNAE
ncbi:MAG: hypothetical protein K6B14_00050 [Lachnospiraceae bacterium]|nr:hypothetical protein [Lachnospiraceae bacterium]